MRWPAVTAEPLVLDAAAMVELLLGTESGAAVRARVGGRDLHAPAHLDAEVLSALARLHRGGRISAGDVALRVEVLTEASLQRHLLGSLLGDAWQRRDNVRVLDGLYLALADRLATKVITTDGRLSRASPVAELVEP